MTYLDDVAGEIERRVPRELIPDGDVAPLFRLYAVLALAKGAVVDAADVHDAWSAWTQERDPGHRSIRPFEELDPETKEADEPFVEAIRAVGRGVGRARG